MLKKIKLLLVFSFVALTIFVVIVAYYQKKQTSPLISSDPNIQSQLFPAPVTTNNNTKMLVKNKAGQEFSVNNLYLNPLKKLSNNGIVFGETEDYHMAFFPKDQSFIVSLLVPANKTIRDLVEQNFLSALGTNQETACQLNVLLSAPNVNNPRIFDTNLSFSFCPIK